MFVVGSWPVCTVECLAASLAYFGTPQNNTHVAFESLMDIEWWNMSPKYTFPAEIKAPPSCFGFYTINKCLSWGLFVAGFFAFLCFLPAISLFKMVSRRSGKAQARIPESKKDGNMPYREHACVRDASLTHEFLWLLVMNSKLMNQQYMLH